MCLQYRLPHATLSKLEYLTRSNKKKNKKELEYLIDLEDPWVVG